MRWEKFEISKKWATMSLWVIEVGRVTYTDNYSWTEMNKILHTPCLAFICVWIMCEWMLSCHLGEISFACQFTKISLTGGVVDCPHSLPSHPDNILSLNKNSNTIFNMKLIHISYAFKSNGTHHNRSGAGRESECTF